MFFLLASFRAKRCCKLARLQEQIELHLVTGNTGMLSFHWCYQFVYELLILPGKSPLSKDVPKLTIQRGIIEDDVACPQTSISVGSSMLR